MDMITIVALVLFVGMIVAWMVLPAAIATGIIDQDAEVVGMPLAQPKA